MNGLREGVSEIFRSLAKGQKVTYADLKGLAKTKKVTASKLYSEAVWACGLAGVDAHSLTSTAPSHMRSPPKRPARHFPKRGHHTGEEKAMLPSRTGERERWAREHGYRNWAEYYSESRRGYEKARHAHLGERYLSLLAGFHRAGLAKERAELLADLAMAQKGIPRAGLKKAALRLSKLPLLYPGRRKRVLDASLQKYKKRFGK